MSQIKVDFYILNNAHERDARRFACRLIEKSYINGQSVYVQVNSLQEVEQIDALLWTFSDVSFIPHNVYSDSQDSPVAIGFDKHPASYSDILLNLNREIPTFYTQFNNVIEIVFSEPIVQQLARDRYRQYRNAGCEINTYKNNGNIE